MTRFKLIIFFGCIVYLSFCLTRGDALAPGGGKGSSRQYRQTRVYYNGEAEDFYGRRQGQQPSNSRPQMKKSLSNSGISAWGIIAIILSVVFIGFAIYYFYLLYPIFCKKERQYNNIELVAV